MQHFYISYAIEDEQRADWIRETLESVGNHVEMYSWNTPETNIILNIDKLLQRNFRIIVVVSRRYLKDLNQYPEWKAAFANDPTGSKGLLLFILIENCKLPGILAPRQPMHLYGFSDDRAKEILLSGVSLERQKAQAPPPFPGFNQLTSCFVFSKKMDS